MLLIFQEISGTTHEIGLPVGDAEHHRLHRGEPRRQAPGVVLDQDRDEALEGAEDRPADGAVPR